jgi:hypothetical protein
VRGLEFSGCVLMQVSILYLYALGRSIAYCIYLPQNVILVKTSRLAFQSYSKLKALHALHCCEHGFVRVISPTTATDRMPNLKQYCRPGSSTLGIQTPMSCVFTVPRKRTEWNTSHCPIAGADSLTRTSVYSAPPITTSKHE